VDHIQKMGLMKLPNAGKPDAQSDKSVQTASRAPQLVIPPEAETAKALRTTRVARKPLVLKHPLEVRANRSRVESNYTSPAEVNTSGLDPEMASAVEAILSKLQSLDGANGTPN
jgi:hypothetical protein